MEGSQGDAPPTGTWLRPRGLARLCITSFIYQGVVFLYYLGELLVALHYRPMSAEAVRNEASAMGRLLVPEQDLEPLLAYAEILRTSGLLLVGVFLLRTVARFVGTLRMWQGWRDGFHIYTMSQLLGCLLPIVIAGPRLFSVLGFLLVLNWCYFYFLLRKTLRP